MVKFAIVAIGLVAVAAVGAVFGNLYHDKLYRVLRMSWQEALMVRVVDGDTLRCERRRLRACDYDTPEARRIVGTSEELYRQGLKARRLLRRLLRSKPWHVDYLWQQDKHIRPLVRIVIDGKSAADWLKPVGLAAPIACRPIGASSRLDPFRRSWKRLAGWLPRQAAPTSVPLGGRLANRNGSSPRRNA